MKCCMVVGLAGIVRNNCLNNTARVGNQLRLHRIDRQVGWLHGMLLGAHLYLLGLHDDMLSFLFLQVPLLLSINKIDISNDLVRQSMQNLEAHRWARCISGQFH